MLCQKTWGALARLHPYPRLGFKDQNLMQQTKQENIPTSKFIHRFFERPSTRPSEIVKWLRELTFLLQISHETQSKIFCDHESYSFLSMTMHQRLYMALVLSRIQLSLISPRLLGPSRPGSFWRGDSPPGALLTSTSVGVYLEDSVKSMERWALILTLQPL